MDFDASPEGHHLRFDPDGQLISVTIVNAKWLLRHEGKIVLTVPERLEVGPEALNDALASAFLGSTALPLIAARWSSRIRSVLATDSRARKAPGDRLELVDQRAYLGERRQGLIGRWHVEINCSHWPAAPARELSPNEPGEVGGNGDPLRKRPPGGRRAVARRQRRRE